MTVLHVRSILESNYDNTYLHPFLSRNRCQISHVSAGTPVDAIYDESTIDGEENLQCVSTRGSE